MHVDPELSFWQAPPSTLVSAVIKWAPAVSSTQEIGPLKLVSPLSLHAGEVGAGGGTGEGSLLGGTLRTNVEIGKLQDTTYERGI